VGSQDGNVFQHLKNGNVHATAQFPIQPGLVHNKVLRFLAHLPTVDRQIWRFVCVCVCGVLKEREREVGRVCVCVCVKEIV
jgi:hypothetical protein